MKQKLNGLNIRHVAQIVRSKMTTKIGTSKKDVLYKKKHKGKNDL